MLHQIHRTELKAALVGRIVPQAAAICFSWPKDAQLQVMLVRSMRTGRWGLPKGGIECGETSAEAAQREAFEEAGVTGAALASPLAHYFYRKDGDFNRYQVAVHILPNVQMADIYPEQGMRERGWFEIADALTMAARPETGRMLRLFCESSRLSGQPYV